MANPSGGYNCKFVDSLPEYIEPYCKICNFVMREPYQATCCGAALCQTCFQKIKENEEPCPDCGEVCREAYMDKKTKKQLNNFRVYCCNQDSGCEWSGRLQDVDDHLNCNPSNEEQLKGCHFTQIKCLYCEHLFKRYELVEHQSRKCHKRPVKCKYCQQYDGSYEEVKTHWLKCSHYPELCPNKCGVKFPRNKIVYHMRIDCPLQRVNCSYESIGCAVGVITRKDLPQHNKECMESHMLLLSKENERLDRELKSERATSEKRIEKLLKENKNLYKENEELRQQLRRKDGGTAT